MKLPLPVIHFPSDLPIVQQGEMIAQAIKTQQVVIIAGETGSGKTTQIPKICLALGRGKEKLIGHTQPRRIAARSVAVRLAQELESELGQLVGYQIRFIDKSSAHTYIKLMTDGILLAEIQRDRLLRNYDTLIIDEAHERSLNIDFLLGYLKHILPKRPDLKIIITSATINPQQFSRYFKQAPIIEVQGRTYPVETWYRPLDEVLSNDCLTGIVQAIDELPAVGDILIFMSSEREIRDTAEGLRNMQWPHTEILPLYARLSFAEQNKIFRPYTGRRIVLATNVAETSLTVPGIRYVIDTGYARISRYSYRTKVQRLPIEPISQASANQRKGRCGREAAGICVRLYSEADFQQRPLFTEPEILRTNLAAVILQMAALQLGNIQNFPFLDKPDLRAIRSAYRLLFELQAISTQQEITPLGKQLALLAIDPRFARMLIAANKEACLTEVLIIVSGLCIQDPRERPHDKQQAADEKHKRYQDEKSDFLAILKLWQHTHTQKAALSTRQFRKYCSQQFISYLRFQEWIDIHRQLSAQIARLGFRANTIAADYQAIHRAILTGLLSHVGFKLAKHEYCSTYNRHFYVFPGSSIASKPPAWLVATELIETTKLYAHTVANIMPEWLEELAAHLLRYHYFEPHWQAKRGYVGAYAKLTLLGLVINAKKKVNYGPIDPEAARTIFIREALVQGQLKTKAAFLSHNQRLLADLEVLEDKTRRRDILVDDYRLYDWYEQQIPSGIYSLVLFEKWYQNASQQQPKLLFFTEADLLLRSDPISNQQFPDFWEYEDLKLNLQYRFEPGHLADGVSIVVPVSLLNQVPQFLFDWLVPGLLLAKMTALLKTLPKELRRHFVPIPDFAKICYEALTATNLPLVQAMAQHLLKVTGVAIPAEVWQIELLPQHLLMNIKVIGVDNQLLAMGRDLGVIRNELQGYMQQQLATIAPTALERTDISHWDFGDLPQIYKLEQPQGAIEVYPALVDKVATVAIELFAEQKQAHRRHYEGLLRLFYLANHTSLSYLRKNLLLTAPGADSSTAVATLSTKFNTRLKQSRSQSPSNYWQVVYSTKEQLIEDVLETVICQVYLEDAPLIYTAREFEQRLAARGGQLVQIANEVMKTAQQILVSYQAIRKQLDKHLLNSEISEQLKYLLFPGFLKATPPEYLLRIPIYLQAIAQRLTKYAQNPARDKQLAMQLQPLWQAYITCMVKDEPLAVEYRWLLEEYRISLFAQPLKTLVPISPQRLQQLWERITNKNAS